MAHKIPKATLTVLFMTEILTGLQFFFPALIVALERRPGMLASGQWWRLITPILINPEGWRQITFNLLGIAIVGALVERLFGSRRWLVLYLVGAVAGELTGMVWKPVGAGSSVAISGLVGGLAAWLMWRNEPVQPRFGGAILVLGALVLTIMRDVHGPPIVAGACAAAVMLSRDARVCGSARE
jgi:rhomboid protease GluP